MTEIEFKYYNIILTENQIELIVDYTIFSIQNEVYLYDQEILDTARHLLENNQISRLFEFNIEDDGVLSLNKNQQNVIADYISIIHGTDAIHRTENYKQAYNYLKKSDLLNELFDAVCENPDY
jgi:hypothetical protein